MTLTGPATVDIQSQHREAIRYIRAKVDQMLALIGTRPLRSEELDDDTLIDLDPIGIVADSFAQVLANLSATNRELLVARNEIRTILDAMGAAVVVLNGDLTIEDCNRQACEWFLRDTEPGHGPWAAAGVDMRMRGGQSSSACSPTDGATPTSRSTAATTTRSAPTSRMRRRVRQDRVPVLRHHPPEADRGAAALYAQVFQNTAEGLIITDAEQRILEVNDAFCRILGYRPEELRGETPPQDPLRPARRRLLCEMWRQINETDHWQGEIIESRPGRRTVPLLETISAVRDATAR